MAQRGSRGQQYPGPGQSDLRPGRFDNHGHPGGAALAVAAGNTWTRDPGSALDVAMGAATLSSSPALSASSSVVVGSGQTAFAVVSGAGTTDWATVSGGKVVALSSGGYANDTYSFGKNSNVTAVNPSPAAFTTDTLAFRTAQTNTLTLSGSNRCDLGGILVGAGGRHRHDD